jgi:hypothetical protein
MKGRSPVLELMIESEPPEQRGGWFKSESYKGQLYSDKPLNAEEFVSQVAGEGHSSGLVYADQVELLKGHGFDLGLGETRTDELGREFREVFLVEFVTKAEIEHEIWRLQSLAKQRAGAANEAEAAEEKRILAELEERQRRINAQRR